VTEQDRPAERQERPVMGRIWEFTKDISIKVSRKAEKHWKINSLRVEIASIRHNINNKYKELGRYVYESLNAHAIEEESYKSTLTELFEELKRLESEILVRENRIELLEQEVREASEAAEAEEDVPPVPNTAEKEAEPETPKEDEAGKADDQPASDEPESTEPAAQDEVKAKSSEDQDEKNGTEAASQSDAKESEESPDKSQNKPS
jgi:hypothetical protein